MTQKYGDDVVYAPGTVIVSASGEVSDVKKVVEPVLVNDDSKEIIYIDFSFSERALGGSAFAQSINKIGKNAPTVESAERFKTTFNTIQELIEGELILAGHDVASGGLITTLMEMCFSDNKTGMKVDLTGIGEKDLAKVLFSENPGIVIQCLDNDKVKEKLASANVSFVSLGNSVSYRKLRVSNFSEEIEFDINTLRDLWFKTSYLLERKQSTEQHALDRYKNYKKLELDYNFQDFTGIASDYDIDLNRRKPTGIKAAIIREKGVNGDREMAYAMYLSGMDVKDVHMTDLIYGRETLEDINMIVFVGGFSNSDVLGSAKGWAGAFKYNEKARIALENFYKRNDTLSLGVCNGCQLMVELDLVYPDHSMKPKMLHNESGKFESAFLNVEILENPSVMLGNMSGMRLGTWVAHGEGKFYLPFNEQRYNIPLKYSYEEYPGNPNGSHFATAAICSDDGRHLAMMPHLERAFKPWQWAHYPSNRKNDEVTPWIKAFVNARNWIKEKK
jgi:phosphoribosylformylglycinamidine synthase